MRSASRHLLLFALLPILASTHAADAEGLSVAVRVEGGRQFLSQQTLRDLQRMLLDRLGDRGCFTHLVDPATATEEALQAADVDLVVTVDDYTERTDYGVSIGQLHSPNAPPDTNRQQTAIVEFRFRASLRVDGVPLRNRTMRIQGKHQPRFDEDPRGEARSIAVRDTAVQTAKFACKGGQKKLARQIEKAREAAAGEGG